MRRQCGSKVVAEALARKDMFARAADTIATLKEHSG
jgi:hypothetical protein